MSITVNEIAGIALRKGYIGLEAEGHEITFGEMDPTAKDTMQYLPLGRTGKVDRDALRQSLTKSR